MSLNIIRAVGLIIAAIAMLYITPCAELYPYKEVQKYQSSRGIVDLVRTEQFEGRRGSVYYERAIYFSDGSRFFYRSPNIDNLLPRIGSITTGEYVEAFHLPEEAHGFRIAQLVRETEVVISLEHQLKEQGITSSVVRLFAMVFMVIGLGILGSIYL